MTSKSKRLRVWERYYLENSPRRVVIKAARFIRYELGIEL